MPMKACNMKNKLDLILFLFPLCHSDLLSQKLWVVDNLLLDHVGLPQVVIVAVLLVIFIAGWIDVGNSVHPYSFDLSSNSPTVI